MPSLPILLDAQEVAELLGVSERQVYALRKRGDLPPPIQLGPRCVRYRRAEVEAMVEGWAAATIAEPPQLVRGKRAARGEEVAA